MADVYAFLELEGVEGEAQDSEYQGKIELQSFSWGASNNSSYAVGTGSGISKGHIHDISFSKYTCKASLRLFERAVTGKPVPKGKLSLLKLTGDKKIPYFVVDLENVVVTSYQIAAHSDGQLPTESSTIHFVIAKSKYQPQGNEGDPSGNVDFGWNLQKNAPA